MAVRSPPTPAIGAHHPRPSGHVLYLKTELTDNRWIIYSTIAMARWLQRTVQAC
jgi:hypothetical protein